ncbi:cytochrome c biogenesis CcdA family protein [Facklamia languida]
MNYLLLFLEGIMTFISPCLLPMIPLYIAYFAGDKKTHTKGQTLLRAGLFMLGFSCVFILMSLFVSTVGKFLLVNRQVVNLFAGGIMVLLGLDYLTGQRLMTRLSQSGQARQQTANPFIFGVIFAVSWTPCVGTFLASALTYIATVPSSFASFMLILCYCIGLGIPFLLCALLIEESKEAITWIKSHYELINRIAGIFLIAFGVLTMTGLLENLLGQLA